jgi:hypothetical protein
MEGIMNLGLKTAIRYRIKSIELVERSQYHSTERSFLDGTSALTNFYDFLYDFMWKGLRLIDHVGLGTATTHLIYPSMDPQSFSAIVMWEAKPRHKMPKQHLIDPNAKKKVEASTSETYRDGYCR